MNPTEWFQSFLQECGSVSVGSMYQCPAHLDSYPSLSVQEGEGQRVLVFCHAGCEVTEVLESLSLTYRRLFETHFLSPKQFFEALPVKPTFEPFEWKQGAGKRSDPRMRWGGSSVVATEYHQYSQKFRMKRLRHDDGRKQCIWEHRENGRWIQGGVSGHLASLPLYQHLVVKAAIEQNLLVVLCESESSVDALLASNIVATTWAGGSSRPQMERLRSTLAGSRVLYIADNDEPGLRCLVKLESELAAHVGSWEVLVGERGEDARDLLEKGLLEHLKLSALPQL